jgi:hypothetical protein
MKALGEGVADQLDAVVHLQLAVVVLDVVLDRPVQDEQLRGDVLVAHAGRDELEHLGLALGQLRRGGCAGPGVVRASRSRSPSSAS